MYGAERWILALVRHLDPERIESIVGVIQDDPAQAAPLIAHAESMGIRTHVFEAPGRFNWSAVGKLRAYLVEQSVDVLHTHFYKTDIVGLLAARGLPVRTVTTPHGWSRDAGFALACYEALDRVAFRWFDAVVPLSDDLLAAAHVSAPGRTTLIRNGVDLDEVRAATAEAPECARWRAERAFVLGYVGQLIPRKDLPTLLRAVAEVPEQDLRLAIVGEGPARGELEQLARELKIDSRVEFLGFRSDRLALLRSFSAIVLPSMVEGIPRCLMEAMGAGIPVVMSDIPGSRELLGPGPTALTFPPGDVPALATHIRCLRSPDARRRLSESAAAFVEERFSAARMAREYATLFESLGDLRGASRPLSRA
jgi:glycosyltransferase involved in cell wall biosynthesis